MKQDFNGIYSVFAVEAQTSTHYGMPVKNLGYDVTDYISQVRMLQKITGGIKHIQHLRSLSERGKSYPLFHVFVK